MNDMLERSSKLIAIISIARNVDNAADIDADGPRQLIALLLMAMLMRMSMLPIDRNRGRERLRELLIKCQCSPTILLCVIKLFD